MPQGWECRFHIKLIVVAGYILQFFYHVHVTEAHIKIQTFKKKNAPCAGHRHLSDVPPA
jgi:hypothetical protein